MATNISYRIINGVATFSSLLFDRILFILAGNDKHTCNDDNMLDILDEFEFQPDWTTDCGVGCP